MVSDQSAALRINQPAAKLWLYVLAVQGDPALTHRLKVASQVFSHWTKKGSEPAGAADRCGCMF